MAGVRLEMLSKVNEGYPDCPLTIACSRTKPLATLLVWPLMRGVRRKGTSDLSGL